MTRRSNRTEGLWGRLADIRDRLKDVLLLKSNVTGMTGDVRRGSGVPVVDRFSHVLSVLYYAEDSGVFFLNDGGQTPVSAVGRVFELTPALAADNALAEGLERILSSEMPGQSVYSVSLFASAASVRETLTEYVRSRSGAERLPKDAAGVLKEMAVRRARMMDERARSLAFETHTPVRHFRVWLSVVCAPGEAELLHILEGRSSQALTHFLRASQSIEVALKQFGIYAYAWDAQDWIDTVREIVNPQKAAAGLLPETSLSGHQAKTGSDDEARVRPDVLRAAAVFPDTTIDVARDGIVFASAGKGIAAAHNAANVLAAAGFQAQVDLGLQVMDLMQSLPLEAGVSLMRDIKTAGRAYTVTRQAAGHMLPVVGEFRGSPARASETKRKPMLMLVARSGELMPIDIFANRNGNYNAVVAGTSGSGKSVLTQEIVTSVLATGGRVWVFDIGKSYETCVELAKGQFIDFEKAREAEQKLCLNPLDMMGEDPAETLDEVAQIIAAMANGSAPMEMTAMELVKVNIAAVVQKARSEGRIAQLSDLVLQLMATRDAALHDVAVRLSPFAAGGRFASWFEGKANVNFEAALVVLEMEALANKPVLKSAVLLICIMRILQEIRTRPRSEKKLIVIDEAWRLLTGESGVFIEWACRTLRKYGAGIVCISQSMEDFRMSGTARAVRANADSVFLFRQKSEGIAAFTSDPALQRTLSGLTTVSETYSEVWARVGDAPGVVGRLILDPFSMTAFSTRADVFDAVRREKAKGKSAVQAIAEVARKTCAG